MTRASEKVITKVITYAGGRKRGGPVSAESRVDGMDRTVGVTMNRIIKVEPKAIYRVWIQFEDGASGEVDLSDLVGKGVFERWTDEEEFRKVRIDEETGTIAWPGEIDLAPDALYRDVAGVKA
jgi:hypothetical protein